MATANDLIVAHTHRLGVARLALTGALAMSIFYAFCWIGARLGLGPATHMYLQLFTNAELSSVTALIIGVCWSIGGGLIAGALIALVYNALAFLDRQ